MTLRFTIPTRLPGLNEMIDAARDHWSKSSKQKKVWTNACMMAINGGEPFDGPVGVEIEWFEPDCRRDPDNIMAGQKYIFDALVARGRLPDDSRAYVRGISHRFHVDAANPRVEVVVYEVKV